MNNLIHGTSAVNASCTLGEGPVWCHDTLWWVDIEGKQVLRWRDEKSGLVHYPLPERVGFAVPAEDGSWQVGLESGIHRWDPDSGSLESRYAPEREDRSTRFNDGKCDPAGRLWAGTMSMKGEKAKGSLYRYTPAGGERILTGVTISNGLAWDTIRKVMYYIDTPTREIAVFDFDPDSSEIANRRVAARIPDDTGVPDGMTIDADGMLWVALWGGGAVICINPGSGEITRRIKVPAPHVTSCTFGGANLETLFITTARAGMKPDVLEQWPESGNVFTARPGVGGLPVNLFQC